MKGVFFLGNQRFETREAELKPLGPVTYWFATKPPVYAVRTSTSITAKRVPPMSRRRWCLAMSTPASWSR